MEWLKQIGGVFALASLPVTFPILAVLAFIVSEDDGCRAKHSKQNTRTLPPWLEK